jgi:subtilase family serine protease
MNRFRRRAGLALTASMMVVSAYAMPTVAASPMIHGKIDEAKRVVLHGNTRPEASAANDLGAMDDATVMPSMLLQLQASPERQAALKQFIDDLHDPKSASYHQWATPDQFASSFGVSQADVATVSAWLQSKGFTVNGVAPTGMQIEFTGTAGQVRKAFGTSIHKLSVKGEAHFANFSDPQIPEALQGAVAGVISMHDFRPHAQNIRKAPKPAVKPNETTASGEHLLSASDLATIYNLTPLFQAGITGKGQTIMVLEDTYLYSAADFTVFRKTYGLTRPYPYGSLSQVAPHGSVTCTMPGTVANNGYAANGDDGEAAIDVEWATAAAPNATIVLAACKDTTAFGGLIALQNTLNGPAASLPSVVSISYGEAEAVNGAAANLSYYTTYQQAVAEGVSIFVSSGDELALSADNGGVSTHGIGISGFASTPYNVAVGGTDFGGPSAGDNTVTWSSTNTATWGSALGYMTETPWNGSCANSYVWAAYADTTKYPTPAAWCASTDITSTSSENNFFDGAFGGSGGPSGCATGTAATKSVVSGTCAGYAKPSWQTGIVGNPSDNVRDIPDVALFASNGILGAFYPVCWSNPSTSDTGNTGGFSCTGEPATWAGFGGTSVSSPIMAAIQALVNQKTGSRWGNPNTVYYAMANAEYGATGSAACNSSTVNKSGPNGCVFYDITQGDIEGVCKSTTSKGVTTQRNCYIASGTIGVSSTVNTPFTSAYSTNVGWDMATGIGSVNGYNLVMNWAAPAQ